MSAYSGTTGATIVYEGALDGTGETITVDFNTPYTYQGGNLLIGIYNTTKGSYKGAYFYGESVEGASVQGHDSSSLDDVSVNQRNFIPKTTFTYTPSSGPVYRKPTDLAVSNITPNADTLTWTPGGSETAWNVEYASAENNQWTTLTVNTPSCTLEDLTNGHSYIVRVQGDYGDGNLSGWATTSFTTLYCDEEDMGEITYELIDEYGDGWSGNAIQVVNSDGKVEATLTLLTGSSTTGTLRLCYGETYSFVWVSGDYGYECTFTLTDPEGDVILSHQGSTSDHSAAPTDGVLTTYFLMRSVTPKPTGLAATQLTYNSATLAWTPGDTNQNRWQVTYSQGFFKPNELPSLPITVVTGNPTLTIANLAENVTYTAYVRAETVAGVSKWSEACTFTTPFQFPAPADLAVTNVTAHNALASWNGNAKGYNLRYRQAAYYDVHMTESFEKGIPDDWTVIDSNADGNNWTIINMASQWDMPAYDGNNALISLGYVSGFITPDNWIITPRVALGGLLKYAIRDDGQYTGTYRIYVSTTDTDINSFTPLTDDLTSPGSTEWTELYADLSAYADKQGYIAFRHYNCNECDYLLFDDICVYGDFHELGEYVAINGITGNSCRLENLSPGAKYEVDVQGTYDGGETSLWTSATFTSPAADALPTELAVTDITDHTATVTWTGAQERYNLRYQMAAERIGFFEDFENGIPDNWTTIDADGDGNNGYVWDTDVQGRTKEDKYGNPTVFDARCATSASFSGSALTPDNWLITPQVELKGKLRVWLRSQDPEWAAEHFAIYASTTGNSIEDFTIVLADTTEAQNVYTEYVFDLSACNGQMGYIAIRHFDVTDMFRLNVDNFFIQYAESMPGEWVTLEGITAPRTLTGLAPDTGYQVQVQGIMDDNTTTDWTEWVKFTTLPTQQVPGDLNGDGTVDVTDVNLIINLVLNQISPDALTGNADLNGDTEVDITDVNMLINLVLEQQ
ncbi:MAG: choice-of-anchor J domain-containing protein [Muribaculaceae bacterium]|nr:choice-of-anchor J domain-containing protein [Muribaculaceae bacterium]